MRGARAVTPALLRRLAPPSPDAAGDKDARGRVLAIGGSTQVPGALLLSGVAALRAGAGKLQLATTREVAGALGVAVPEAMVVGLAASRAGEIKWTTGARKSSRAADPLMTLAAQANAVLLGPGMSDARAARALLADLVRHMRDEAVLVIDAAGITGLRDDAATLAVLGGRVVVTPHAGEMATLLGVDKQEVEAEPARIARAAARQFGATVALKGPESWIAEPDGTLYHYAGGTVGLATSGSGDTLAGIVAGLAARGTPAAHAAVWGAYLHGAAGKVLARRLGPIGFLARELLDEIPSIMWKLGRA